MEPMSFRQKLDNFWYYYKVHVLAGIGLLVLIGGAVLTSRPSGPPTALSVDVIGGALNGTQTQLDALQKEASIAVFGLEGAKHHGVGIDFMPMSGTLSNPSNGQVQMSLMAHISARDLDVVILDPPDFRMFQRNKLLTNLASLPADDVIPSVSSTSGKAVYGVPVAASKKLNNFVMPRGSMVGILSNTKRLPDAVAFIRWLVNQH